LANLSFPSLKKAPDLGAGRIKLTHLSAEFVSDRYVDWMNDYEIVKYTESRFAEHTIQSIEQFVNITENDINTVAWAITVDSQHIGNIKLGPVDWHHSYADIGLIVGSKEHWGLGYGTESIKLVGDWAFATLQLHKLTAGFYDGNAGSMHAFEKAGFSNEARQSSHYHFEGEYIDRLIMARFNPAINQSPTNS
jgi:[ribosomal protein S5]-alanine N-acetyltransferase